MAIYDELTSINWPVDHNDKDLIRYDEMPSYETFIRECLIPNRAALFTTKCGLTDSWSCRIQWVNDDKSGPNFDRLRSLYGHLTVPVTKCSSTNDYNSTKNTFSMSFDEFVHFWRDDKTSGDYYCKDWHLQKFHDENETALLYSVPIYFQSDWLNEMCLAENQDDFRFVYMGGNGTFTPNHIDVLASYSWSANICGEKLWHFSSPKSIEFIQRAGEIVFVPSQWHHHVTNIGHTISVNHNWINAFNIQRIWKHLCTTLDEIEHRIDDCRSIMADGWYAHCQLILQANEGLNFGSFYKLLHHIAQNRLKQTNDPYGKFDLWTIEKLLREIIQNAAFLHAYDFDTLVQRPKMFINQIHSFIDQQKQCNTDGQKTKESLDDYSKNDGPS